MARTSQYWILMLVAVLMAISAASVVSAADQVAPTFAERMEDAKKVGREQAVKIKGRLDALKDWTLKTTGEWTAKGKEQANEGYGAKAAETLRSSTLQTHETVTGIVNRWSAWAKGAADKYVGAGKTKVTNPAADAAAYINTHIPGSSESKDDEL